MSDTTQPATREAAFQRRIATAVRVETVYTLKDGSTVTVLEKKAGQEG